MYRGSASGMLSTLGRIAGIVSGRINGSAADICRLLLSLRVRSTMEVTRQVCSTLLVVPLGSVCWPLVSTVY